MASYLETVFLPLEVEPSDLAWPAVEVLVEEDDEEEEAATVELTLGASEVELCEEVDVEEDDLEAAIRLWVVVFLAEEVDELDPHEDRQTRAAQESATKKNLFIIK